MAGSAIKLAKDSGEAAKRILEEKGIDAICTGEGDTAFDDFINRIQNGEDYWLTKSFYVKYKGEIFKNGLAPLVDELDDLPYPDRDLLYDADPSLAEVGLKAPLKSFLKLESSISRLLL